MNVGEMKNFNSNIKVRTFWMSTFQSTHLRQNTADYH